MADEYIFAAAVVVVVVAAAAEVLGMGGAFPYLLRHPPPVM